MFSGLINIFIQRKPMRDLLMERVSFFKAISRYLVVTLIGTIIAFIVMAVNAVSVAITTGIYSALLTAFISIIINTLMFPVSLVLGLILLYILGFIVFALARLLGGKGGYLDFMKNKLMVLSAVMLVMDILYLIFGVLMAIPFAGGIFSIVFALISIIVVAYSLYLIIKLVSEHFEISMLKSAVAVLLPIILLIILLVIIWLIFMLVFSFAALMALIGLAAH